MSYIMVYLDKSVLSIIFIFEVLTFYVYIIGTKIKGGIYG